MFESGDCKTCLRIVRKISHELTSTLDVGEVLDNIVRLTAEATKSKGCALRLLNEKTKELDLSAACGLSQNYLSKGPLGVDASMAACMKGEVVYVEDATSDPRMQYPDHARSEGIASMLSVPMLLRDQFVGVLRIYSPRRRQYAEEEVEFVRTLADLGTLAIEHARLYTRLKADHESLIEDFHSWFESGVHHQ